MNVYLITFGNLSLQMMRVDRYTDKYPRLVGHEKIIK